MPGRNAHGWRHALVVTWQHRWFILALLIVLIAGTWYAARLYFGPSVVVDQVVRGNLVQTVVASGHVESRFRVDIGSQITDLQPFDDAFSLLVDLVGHLRADGHAIDHIDLGGGLGIPYRTDNEPPPLPDAYAAIVRKHVAPLGVKAMFEPGRMIVGNAGILVSEVIYLKEGAAKNFLIVDAAMNDLIRPTLYDAFHDIFPVVQQAPSAPRMRVDVVGPVCETGDFLGLDRDLPKLKAGDLIAVGTAGAYGAVQAGTYNTRLLAPEVLVDGGRFHVVRPRRSYDELIGLDSVPDWLA